MNRHQCAPYSHEPEYQGYVRDEPMPPPPHLRSRQRQRLRHPNILYLGGVLQEPAAGDGSLGLGKQSVKVVPYGE